ncbi:hypothetical protein [Erythrobacter sp.]|jgi:hypothetical protein|uniref:hypothetical protein n=1 Tax=Erythrobacter sp. TaxID=1042 RepID=UPI002EAB3C04|nr:hypothetical protein [Erythrobacter sp.]
MIRPYPTLACLAASALTLAACDAEEESAELEVATTDGEAAALANAVDPADFAELELGAKIVGPQGPEVKTSLSNEAGILADITSYVACPAGIDPCDPASAPEGTVYTYVHIVYPGEDMDPSTGAGDGPDDADIEMATGFRMIAPALGFNGVAGFSNAEAIAAAGDGVEVVVTCDDAGALIWTVNAGDGGNQWEDAEPLTFFWQSTLPPAGPAAHYEIRTLEASGAGEGPYPGPDADASNACMGVRA